MTELSRSPPSTACKKIVPRSWSPRGLVTWKAASRLAAARPGRASGKEGVRRDGGAWALPPPGHSHLPVSSKAVPPRRRDPFLKQHDLPPRRSSGGAVTAANGAFLPARPSPGRELGEGRGAEERLRDLPPAPPPPPRRERPPPRFWLVIFLSFCQAVGYKGLQSN